MPRFHHAHCSLVNLGVTEDFLVNLGVTEDFLDGLEGAAEEVLAKLLNMSMGDGGVKLTCRSQWRFGWQTRGYGGYA